MTDFIVIMVCESQPSAQHNMGVPPSIIYHVLWLLCHTLLGSKIEKYETHWRWPCSHIINLINYSATEKWCYRKWHLLPPCLSWELYLQTILIKIAFVVFHLCWNQRDGIKELFAPRASSEELLPKTCKTLHPFTLLSWLNVVGDMKWQPVWNSKALIIIDDRWEGNNPVWDSSHSSRRSPW